MSSLDLLTIPRGRPNPTVDDDHVRPHTLDDLGVPKGEGLLVGAGCQLRTWPRVLEGLTRVSDRDLVTAQVHPGPQRPYLPGHEADQNRHRGLDAEILSQGSD